LSTPDQTDSYQIRLVRKLAQVPRPLSYQIRVVRKFDALPTLTAVR